MWSPRGPLSLNRGLVYLGAKPYGEGFVLSPPEAERFIQERPANREVIRDYVGGEDLNNSPDGASFRLVIDFGERSLDECVRRWPELLERIRQTVKPDRDRNKRASYRERDVAFRVIIRSARRLGSKLTHSAAAHRAASLERLWREYDDGQKSSSTCRR